MPPIISVENLSKSYLVGHQSGSSERYTALREVLGRSAKNFVRKGLDMARGRQIVQGDEVEEFWALKDVSFEAQQGEVLGIIGRNGAGKSTLLKILSRITEPTQGRVSLRGRVASLLEVGTGFHPELTGRENIFLNGAILGMTRSEIKRKFDEIVAFAEVDKFLDTPVKRYSSGMYVRLAFAVAAHLDPEILVVDEVLAVGDMAFQRKCLGKMRDVASQGRTVLIVSHNMPMIKALCTLALLLSGGKVEMNGNVDHCIQAYLTNDSVDELDLERRTDRQGTGEIKFTSARVEAQIGRNLVPMGSGFQIVVDYAASVGCDKCDCSIHINDQWGQPLLRFASRESGIPFSIEPGAGRITCHVPKMQLLPGKYNLLLAASRPPAYEYFDYIANACSFEVVPADVYQTGKIPEYGVFYTECEWKRAQ